MATMMTASSTLKSEATSPTESTSSNKDPSTAISNPLPSTTLKRERDHEQQHKEISSSSSSDEASNSNVEVDQPLAKRSKNDVDNDNSSNASGVSGPSKNNVNGKEATTTTTTAVPSEDSETSEQNNSTNNNNNNGEVLDLAVTFGYKPGDRLEVQWEVGEDDENNPDNINTRWWPATLLEFDGRTEDSVAIRVLDYDEFPEGGFPERSLEDVIFLGHDLLVSPDESQTQLTFRRQQTTEEGDSSNQEPLYRYNKNQMEQQLNDILMGALQKNQQQWNTLSAAKQAIIAQKMATKKEQLMDVLLKQQQQQSTTSVITSATMKDLLQQTFQQK